MKKIRILLIGIIAVFLLPGCGVEQNSTQIAATTLPVYEFTSYLCQGTNIEVVRLVTEDISCLHDYTVQVRQMRIIEEADLIIISGAGLEDFLDDTLTSANALADASAGIELHCGDHIHTHDSETGHSHDQDPHIWLSPENAKNMAENICNTLVQTYPQRTQTFLENNKRLTEEFDKLSIYAEELLQNISNRDLITFHDGFSYMAEAFDLHIVHAIEEEAGSEASAQELIDLINIVSEHQINAIFTEKNSSSSGASIIAEETGAKVYQLDMALSGDSYFTAMYNNIDTLKEALN